MLCNKCSGNLKVYDAKFAKCERCGQCFVNHGGVIREADVEEIYAMAESFYARKDMDSLQKAIHLYHTLKDYKDSRSKAQNAEKALTDMERDWGVSCDYIDDNASDDVLERPSDDVLDFRNPQESDTPQADRRALYSRLICSLRNIIYNQIQMK